MERALADQKLLVHPIVLLSISDHYARVAKGTSKRVVGILLGEQEDEKLRVTSSYAVPFEEDARDPRVWFLDVDYAAQLFIMFKKVHPRERVIGWYSTGTKLRPGTDSAIHEKVKRWMVSQLTVSASDPLMCLVHVDNSRRKAGEGDSNAAQAFCFEHGEDGGGFRKLHVDVEGFEAEHIGVEHLLRDHPSHQLGGRSLGEKVVARQSALELLRQKLQSIERYVAGAVEEADDDGALPADPQILANVQELINALPSAAAPSSATKQVLTAKANDASLAVFAGSLVRAGFALHDLSTNRTARYASEREKIPANKGGDGEEDAGKEKAKAEASKEGESKENSKPKK